MGYLFTIAAACTSLLETTPAERKEKGWKPVAILASFALPINTLRIYYHNPPLQIKNSFAMCLGVSCFITGMEWCAGRQFGHIVGQVLDEKTKVVGT